MNEFSRNKCDYHLINGYNICVAEDWPIQEEKKEHKFEAGGSHNNVVTVMIEPLMRKK